MKKIVLAFSGGLDTSFCVPYLIRQYGAEVHTVTVDCMGLEEVEKDALAEKALLLGAVSHKTLDGIKPLYDEVLSYLIKGNVLRDRTYPLCVGAERYIQARLAAKYAAELGADAIAHGSTGAGNDQIRFDTALRTLSPGMEIITPVRDESFTREYQVGVLKELGLNFDTGKSPYSINSGIWGTTVGGHETLTSNTPLPFEAFPNLPTPDALDDEPEVIKIGFEKGLPVSLDDKKTESIELLEKIRSIGIYHGIGRGMHTGDTILGFKGRIGFEAPVAAILYAAHSELEKLVLTKWQRHLKSNLADHYGMLLHEAHYFDPAARDIEAFFDHSQEKVTGESSLYVYRGSIFPYGVDSPYSLMKQKTLQYGEQSGLWNGTEARAFSKLYGLSSLISNQAGQ